MSPEPVRVGVIGVGEMGAAHAENLADRTPGAVVTRVYDIDTVRAVEVAERVGASMSDSAEGLVADPGVDAVLVAAPDALHEILALACITAGKPVLLEKPIASSVTGGRRVVDAEVAAGRRLVQLGFMRRYDPAYVDLRAAVAGGAVGRVRAAHCVHRNARSHPSHTDETVLSNSMVHELDCVPWLLGDPLSAVTVFAGRVPPGELKDLQVAVLETAAGIVVTVEVYVNAGYGYDIRAEVVGTAGTATLPPRPDGPSVSQDAIEHFRDAYRIEVGAWVEGVRAGVLSGPTAWDGHRANVAAFSAVESLHGAGRVVIAPEVAPALYL